MTLPGLTSNLVKIPSLNTENDDKNPPRIAPRSLFRRFDRGRTTCLAGDKKKWSLRLSAINMSNKYALYNFLSTFQRHPLCNAACFCRLRLVFPLLDRGSPGGNLCRPAV